MDDRRSRSPAARDRTECVPRRDRLILFLFARQRVASLIVFESVRAVAAAGFAAVAAVAEELLGENDEGTFVVEVDAFAQRGHGGNDIPISLPRVCAYASPADCRR